MNRRCLCVSRNHRSSLPPGGEGGAPAPDEGEIGERTIERPAPLLVRVPVGGVRYAVRLNNGKTAAAGWLHEVVPFADFALIRRFAPPSPPGGRLFRWCGALCDTPQQRRSRLLAPRLGRGSLCGNGWWEHLIFGGLCRYDEVICSEMTRWGTGAWDED